jgi:hypothetical protein
MAHKNLEQLLEHIYDSNNGFEQKNHDNAHHIIVIFEHSGKKTKDDNDNITTENYQIDKAEQVEQILDNLSVLFQIEKSFPHYAEKAWSHARILIEKLVNEENHERAYTLNHPEDETYIHMHRVIINLDEFFKPVLNEQDYQKLQQLVPSVFAHIQAEQNPQYQASSTISAEEQYAKLLNREQMLSQQLQEVQQQLKSFEQVNVAIKQHRLEEMNRQEPAKYAEHYQHDANTNTNTNLNSDYTIQSQRRKIKKVK